MSGMAKIFPPIGGKKQRHGSASITAFVIGCAAPGLYTNNHPVWKTQSAKPLDLKENLNHLEQWRRKKIR
jgi:hypothetical protein